MTTVIAHLWSAMRTARGRRVLWWVGMALPPVIVFSLILTLAVDVPALDDWDAASVVIAWREHTLSIRDFWEQALEHRIVFVRVLVWVLGMLTNYSVVAEMFLGFACVALALVIVSRLLTTSLSSHQPIAAAATLIASLLLFSLALHENWFFGEAALELALYPASVILVWALTRTPAPSRAAMGTALMCALVATFTEASGFALWATGAVAIWSGDRASRRRERLALWLAVAGLTTVGYMWGLHWDGDAMESAIAPASFVTFLVTSLGVPFAYGTTTSWAAVVGAGGCIVGGAAAVYLRVAHDVVFRRMRPVVVLAIHGVLIAGLIALGRAHQGAQAAMVGHLAIGANFFWMATLPLAAVAIVHHAMHFPAGRWWKQSAARFAVLVCAIGYAAANVAGYTEAVLRSHRLRTSLAALYVEPVRRDVLEFLYPPDDHQIQSRVAAMKHHELGPFGARARAHNAHLVDEFAGRLPSASAIGFHDGGDCAHAVGWVWDPTRPTERFTVDVWAEDTKLGSTTANWFRDDLRAARMGDGHHSFIFAFRTPLESGRDTPVTVTFGGTRRALPGSPRVIRCE